MRKIFIRALCAVLLLALAGGALLFRQRGGAPTEPEVLQNEPEPVPEPETQPEPEAPAAPAEPEEQTLEGVLKSYDGQTLELVFQDGTQRRFSVPQVLVTAPQTPRAGCRVRITCTGSEENPEILAVTISDFSACPAEEAAQNLLLTLSLEEKVGQLFLARCPDADAAQKAAEYHLGGYILFGRDFSGKSADEVRETIASYQQAAGIPLLIAVDEEGGTVCRVSSNPQLRAAGRFASPQALYQSGGLEAVRADTEEKCALLASLGINVNMAPVCDVSENPDDFIYERSLGRGAEETAEYVRTVVEQMRSCGLGSVLKHFPGYGNNEDTHTGIAIDSRSYENFTGSDFLPFAAGIAAGADAVLVSHNIVQCMDAERPASLSPEVHRVLREELGFTGVCITDDLAMDAIGDYCDGASAAVLAVLAGNDLLCCSDFQTQYAAVLAAAQNGTIPLQRIDEAVQRVLTWKCALGLFN